MLPAIVKNYCGKVIGEDDITDLIDGEPFSIGEGFVQVKFL